MNAHVGIKQGSWTQLEQSRLRRDFEYQVQYSNVFGTAHRSHVAAAYANTYSRESAESSCNRLPDGRCVERSPVLCRDRQKDALAPTPWWEVQPTEQNCHYPPCQVQV